MPKIALMNQEGASVGEIELSEEIFAADVNEAAIHLVVRSQLAAKRQGTQSAKTRGEVRGGGRKIYRQKGTGNARHHSNRAPQFTHGGVVFAPKPRSYAMSVNKKARRLAIKSALSAKLAAGEMIVLDTLSLDEAKTKKMVAVLKALSAEKALIVTPAKDETVVRAANNIPGVATTMADNLNVYDILKYDKFIITVDAVGKVTEVYA